MTLGIALFAKDNSAILISDKRVTGGTFSLSTRGDFVEKIRKVTDKCALTLSGDGGIGASIIDLFLKEFKIELTRQGVKEIPIKEVAEIFRRVAVENYEKWYGAMPIRLWTENIKEEVIPFFRILLIGFDKDESGELKKGKILQLSAGNRFAPSEITTNFAAIGISGVAQYLLYRFYHKKEEVEVASLAAFCVQETSSQDGAVGEDFQIATFSDTKKFRFYKDEEIEKIKLRCSELKTQLQTSFFPSKGKPENSISSSPPTTPPTTPPTESSSPSENPSTTPH